MTSLHRLLIFLVAGFVTTGLFAEGTVEIMPDSTKGCRFYFSTDPVRDPFALFNGDADYRLLIHISDSSNEKIYFGIGALTIGIATMIRVHRPGGTVIFSTINPSSGAAGFIDYYTQCVTGPNVLNPGGYNPFVVTPDVSGDYFITIEVTGWPERVFNYLDISVIRTFPLERINGRVFSKSWQLKCDNLPSGVYYPFLGQIYHYSKDGIVTKFDPNGLDGRYFSLTSNESGCYPAGPSMPLNEARKSREGRHTYPQYKLFLNNPDETVYPTGTLGTLINHTPVVQALSDCNTGTIRFVFEISGSGTGMINLQLNTLGPQYTDRLITQNLTSGWDTIVWDGYDGSIPPIPVPHNSTFPVMLYFVNGMIHFPMFDVENNPNGFVVNLIRPLGPEPNFYWDDTELNPPMPPGPALSPPGGCMSSVSPCHIWSGADPGNERSVNTWWFISNDTVGPVMATLLRDPPVPGPVYGPSQFCPGVSGYTYWVNTLPGSTGFTWGYTGTGATITPVNDTTVSVSYAGNATSGDLTVNGNNPECGAGPAQTLAITIHPPPVVTLAAFSPVCINTAAFTLTGGSPAGGSYWVGSLQVTTFNPAAAGPGSHAVIYMYTDPSTSCTGSDTQFIVVNSPPVVTLDPLDSVCINAPAYLLSGGNPAGGSFSGPGVSGGNLFTPSVAGAGTHSILYTYTDLNSCVNSDTSTLVVFTLTAVALAPQPAVCINAAPFPLTGGTPPGGTYSGPGVSGGVFDPLAAGVGTHTITYTSPGANGCINSDSEPLTVNPLPGNAGTITGATSLCQATTGTSYSTTPIPFASGYSWTVTPVIAGTFTGNTAAVLMDWSAGYSGSAQITVTGSNGCGEGVASAPLMVNVNPNPVVSLRRCIDSVMTTNAKPITLKGGMPPGGTWSGDGVNGTQGILDPALAGSGSHMLTYTYTNVHGCTASAIKTCLILTPTPWSCGSLLTDIRDGKIYPTVQIGTQCWMAQNLDFGFRISDLTPQTDNCIAENYKNPNSPLSDPNSVYQWDEIMNYDDAPGVQGLCPPGWHVPDESEWTTLFNHYLGNSRAAPFLQDPYIDGFKALQSGVYYLNSAWSFTDFATFFWSSTLAGPTRAWSHGMNTMDFSVSLYAGVKTNGFPVRCLKD